MELTISREAGQEPVIVVFAARDGHAIERIAGELPAGRDMAFIVVTTARAPQLEELRKSTTMPLVEVHDRAVIQADHIYVIPPGRSFSFQESELRAGGDSAGVLPLDKLLRSLAKHHPERSAVLLFSGIRTDGSVGAAELKATGSLVIVQSPINSAEGSLPEQQLLAKIADVIVPLPRMLAALIDYFPLPPDKAGAGDEMEVFDASALAPIFTILSESTGNDFSRYKRSTVSRRIQRRMRVHGLKEPERYVELLMARPTEAALLFNEMLIGVTSFFRDPETYEVLEKALDDYLAHLRPNQDLRVWVPACSTGEEAYSIAILLDECVRRANRSQSIKIFATDVDARAIDFARAGRYPRGITAYVSPERLERYFVQEDETYRINKETRERIVFAPHNVTHDPPFTHIDLLSCRNLLIYLEPELQHQVLQVFGYALEPRGLLLLGGSESLGSLQGAFEVIDKKTKLFSQRETHAQRAFALPLDSLWGDRTGRREDRLLSRAGARHSAGSVAEQVLMSEFVPPSAIIAPTGELAYIHGRTGSFLEPAAGEPSTNIFDMAREGLRLELPAAVRAAHHSHQQVVRRGLSVRTNGSYETMTVTVKPLKEPDTVRGLLLVTFEIEARTGDGAPAPESEQTSNLEAELHYVRTTLQGMIEDLESSNEELKSMNEELQSTNEEVQSSNEELSTSREELQSMNEELQTLNEELAQRNSLLSQSNDDMHNLLSSVHVATVFVDPELNIRRFTAPAKNVFRLRDSDIGRPVSDLVVNLDYQTLVEDAHEVLRTLVFAEREVQTTDGEWRLMRILPYRTANNVIDGLIITVTDIQRLKQAQRECEENHALFDDVIANTPLPLVVLDESFRILAASVEFARRFGTTQPALVGKQLGSLGAGWRHPALLEQLEQLAREPCPMFRVQGTLGTTFPVDVIVHPRRLNDAHSGARYLFLFQDAVSGQLPAAINVD